jgi:pantoate kinase
MPLQSARTVTGPNQWTTPIVIIGWFTVTIRRADGAVGSLGGTTVTVQRSVDNGVSYQDVDIWTKTSEDIGFEADSALYTIGVKGGEYFDSVYVGFTFVGSVRA